MNLLIGICLMFWCILNVYGVKMVVYEFTDILSDRAGSYLTTRIRVLGVIFGSFTLAISVAVFGFSIAAFRDGVCPMEYLR